MAFVNNNEAGFLAAYEHEHFCQNPLMMKHLIKLLHLLVKSDDFNRIATRTLARILSANGSYALFIMKLDLLIKNMITETSGHICRENPQYLHFLLEIGNRAIKVIPDTILGTFPLDVIRTTIQELTKRGESVSGLPQKLEDTEKEFEIAREKKSRQVRAVISDVDIRPPQHFLQLEILPLCAEVHSSDDQIFLSRNLVEGAYRSWDHYLDVHYRLLREDFVRPLRHGIQHYCSPDLAKTSQDVRIYEGVRVLNPVCLFTGIGFQIQFDISRLRRVNWEYSRRLIFGSLLCLSTDNFKHSMLFATVVKREVSLLEEGCLIVKFEGDTNGFQINPDQVFTMVESTAYFEAYRHILNKLKDISSQKDQIPFKSCIVELAVSNIFPPSYYQRCTKFDLTNVLGMKSEVTLLNESSWPKAEATCLDSSQLDALKMALTKEVSVIQGPPGTGKTFIGLKIVEAFLRNRSVWDRNKEAPILVVCYTNHALDQFLEGIQSICIEGHTPNIVRIGGRCKSERLADCILRAKLNTCQERNELPHRLLKKQAKSRRVMLNKKGDFNKSMKSLFSSGLVTLVDLENCMHPRHYNQLFKGVHDKTGKQQNQLEVWLDLIGHETKSNPEPLDTDGCEMSLRAEVEDDCIKVVTEAALIEEDRILEGEEVECFHLETTLSNKSGPKALTAYPTDCKVASSDVLSNVEPMSQKEASQVCDVRRLPPPDRWRIYNFWRQEFARHRYKELEENAKQYEFACEEHSDVSKKVDECVLRGCDVIGITTTGAAKHHHVLRNIHPKIVIFEEAAEIFEAHIVTSLAPSVQQLVLIGDHKQLQPKPNCYDLEREYNLSVSLFERLIRNHIPFVTLSVQHRMRPEISSLVHPSIYHDLQDHDSVKKYSHVLGVAKDVFFIDHTVPEKSNQDSDTTTHVNVFEAEYLVSLCRYLLKQGYQPGAITILTMYRGQLLELKRKMRRKDFEGVRVAAVDDFQGEENDIILLSLVRSNPEQNIGFVSSANRICVSLSRAKKGFYVIGNSSMLRGKSNTVWPQIISELEKKQCLGKALPLYCRLHERNKVFVETPDDFLKCPEGGCNERCGRRFACGHTCPRICHTYDTDHSSYCCLEVCSKELPCGHKCRSKCHECMYGCKPCSVVIKKDLSSCHHKASISIRCSQSNITDYCCPYSCKKRLKCGHVCRNKCSEPCTVDCLAQVKKSLPCGHEVEGDCCKPADQIVCTVECKELLDCGHTCVGTCSKCHLGRLHVHCQQNCDRPLVCGHICKFPCASNCPPCNKACNNFCVHSNCPRKCYEVCDPCMEPCQWQCKHYKCTQPCGEICDRPPCDAPCTKKLKCGHDCIGLCGEKCPDLCRICDKEVVCDIFFGTEEEDDARFVVLEDCSHHFEASSLDRYILNGNESGEVKFPSCPRCKTPIRKSLRYCNQVKKTLKDVEQIKRKQIRTKSDTLQLYKTLTSETAKSQYQFVSSEMQDIRGFLNVKVLHPFRIDTIFIQISVLKQLVQVYEVTSALAASKTFDLKLQHACDAKSVLESLRVIKQFVMQESLSQQQVSDVSSELRRISCSARVCDLLCKLHSSKCNVSSEDQQELSQAVTLVNTSGWTQDKLTEESEKNLLELIKQISKSYNVIGLTNQEKQMVVKAIGLQKGHWYKCPNGHVYCIGECGGAMQASKCPECGAVIGGGNHALAAGNAHAPEMDGSQHSAWSEAANLANFDPVQLRHL